MFRKFKLRLRALFHRNDIGNEFETHLEQLTDELISQGLSPQQAAMAARRRFGSLARFQEQSYDLFSFRMLEDLLRDLHYGWRSIRRSPSVAAAAVMSMGLAIGVNTLVFSLIHEVFFSKPTTRAADELVTIQFAGSSHTSLPNLRDLNASGSFEKVAGFDVETTVNWRTGNTVRQTPAMLVSENYFELWKPGPPPGGCLEATRRELN